MGNRGSSKPPEPGPFSTHPWRKVDPKIWTDEEHDAMLESLKDCFKGSASVKCANIVLIGPAASGKSSFVSSVFSIGETSVLPTAHSGQDNKSYTFKLGVHEGSVDRFGHIKLYDTMGLEDEHDEGLGIDDIKPLLQGHILKGYPFNPRSPISSEDHLYKKEPDVSDRINLVVFCFKASLVMREQIAQELIQKVTQIQNTVKTLEIPRMLLLTHVDQICPEVSKDIKKIFLSKAVNKAVIKAEEWFNIPAAFIHPVENYHKEPHTDKMTNVPLLLALRHMLEVSNNYVRCTYSTGANGSSNELVSSSRSQKSPDSDEE